MRVVNALLLKIWTRLLLGFNPQQWNNLELDFTYLLSKLEIIQAPFPMDTKLEYQRPLDKKKLYMKIRSNLIRNYIFLDLANITNGINSLLSQLLDQQKLHYIESYELCNIDQELYGYNLISTRCA